jgi:hypothetical protein
MPIELPNEVSRRLSEFEAVGAPLNAIELAGQLHAAAGPDEALTEEQRRGCLAEIASLRFMVARGTDTEPWGIYFKPLGTFVDNAGVPRHGPDARWMDAEIIEYWKTRAASCPHAALRARYADLAREIGDLWNRDHPQSKVDKPRALSQLTANSYIDAVDASLAKDAYVSWQWLERALTIAATIKDPQLIERAKKAALEFQRARDEAGESGLWWRLDDVMAGAKGVAWTDAEKAEVCDLLRKRLALASDIASKEFDPHAATGAADRLARWVDSAEKISALRTAGGAFEAMAANANALVATAWLEELSRRYRDAKLDADANRVDGVIRARADEAVASMKKTSTSIEIPPEEMQSWLDEIVQGPLPHGLARIAFALLNDPKKMEEQIKTMALDTPIHARMNISITGFQGFTAAVIGSIDDDMPGRLLHQLADIISMSGPFLHQALARATVDYSLDPEGWMAYFATSPLFPAASHGMLRVGIDAWIGGDYVKAVHVLVPQVEAALRESLIAMGESPMRPAKTGGGFEAIGMGAILNHDVFRARIPPAIRWHLRALYSDPRGINLRNKLAHGHAGANLLGLGIANWVIHSLVTIRAFGLASPQEPTAAPPAP